MANNDKEKLVKIILSVVLLLFIRDILWSFIPAGIEYFSYLVLRLVLTYFLIVVFLVLVILGVGNLKLFDDDKSTQNSICWLFIIVLSLMLLPVAIDYIRGTYNEEMVNVNHAFNFSRTREDGFTLVETEGHGTLKDIFGDFEIKKDNTYIIQYTPITKIIIDAKQMEEVKY
ncbi:hypothetical protein [Dethiobacter alkaliphilus]|uniref:Uncharacterized protein n=1 Tax=Dethiobacter alkaliphilus AHT 1 TaxID=555088 RepID=C0GHQ7_DETAL|nr:hypothetical protein [Dethiobacter alkaliphilus]EEG77263.1 hypothetical protein DealDRAFT_2016 [Dethiobacter alkaliphilus AHT 1]